ncbi:MAG TPA: hypothetical protein VFF20_00595 [Pseudogracilibacillus sp.]|nr:hypothetical protein [Pseudogracilibacillus sp.]
MNKFLDLILWGVIGLTIVIFVASIMVGHSTSYQFLSSNVEQEVVVTSINQVLNS